MFRFAHPRQIWKRNRFYQKTKPNQTTKQKNPKLNKKQQNTLATSLGQLKIIKLFLVSSEAFNGNIKNKSFG